MSQKLKIAELIPHRDNDYFFDDIQGEAWQEFIDSVKTSGVIEPIVVTQDKVIVSGHQRVRACKALGIDEIDAEVRIIDSEDELLKQLIETNIRQRGIGNTNPVKFGRCLDELKRIYGIHNGGVHGNSLPNNSEVKTNEELASSTGVSVDTMENYIKLSKMIPEMQDLVETGIVTPTTARAIVKQLPEFQQKELAEQLSGSEKKVSQREVQKYIDTIAEKDRRIKELENREPEVKTVVKEVVPDDYEDLKEQAKMADVHKKDFQHMRKAYDEMADKWKKSESEKQKLIDKANEPEVEKAENIKRSALFFCAGVSNFIERYGGYVWLTQEIDNMEKSERDGYIRAINAIEAWASQMKANLKEG